MKDAASDAKKTMVDATSAGVPTLPRGCQDAEVDMYWKRK